MYEIIISIHMAAFLLCYGCSPEFVLHLQEALVCTPHIYIDARPEPHIPCVVITNYQGVVATFTEDISIPEIVAKVFQSIMKTDSLV